MVAGRRFGSRVMLALGLVPVTAFLAGVAWWAAGDMVTGISSDLEWQLAAVMVALLALITLRYASLAWLGYLHHLEAQLAPDPPPGGPPVTIIVPAYNEGAVIQASIRSLLRLEYQAYEILVVDDGSTDDTLAQAARLEGQHGPATVRVVSKRHGGKADSLNVGIGLARTPYVLCMDGDSVLAPDTLRHAMRHFADPRVAAVAGNVKVGNRDNAWTRMQALEYIVGLNLTRRAQGFLRSVSIVPGPLGVFRRDVLEAVGRYDCDTFAEDTDLTLKILGAGWAIVYEDRAVAWTEAPETLLDLIKQRYRWSRGMMQALAKRSADVALPRRHLTTWLSLQVMLFESLVWPLLDVVANVLGVAVALATGGTTYLLLWVGLLTLYEIAVTLHLVALDREDLALVPFAVFSRFVYSTIISVVKLFAMGDELFRRRMDWGKLERAGRIGSFRCQM